MTCSFLGFGVRGNNDSGSSNFEDGDERSPVHASEKARPRRILDVEDDRIVAALRELALGDGTHKLPVAAALRRAIDMSEGDDVDIVIQQRLN